jgi:hypothetical protein
VRAAVADSARGAVTTSDASPPTRRTSLLAHARTAAARARAGTRHAARAQPVGAGRVSALISLAAQSARDALQVHGPGCSCCCDSKRLADCCVLISGAGSRRRRAGGCAVLGASETMRTGRCVLEAARTTKRASHERLRCTVRYQTFRLCQLRASVRAAPKACAQPSQLVARLRRLHAGMPPRRSARVAEAAERACSALVPLPHALVFSFSRWCQWTSGCAAWRCARAGVQR